MPPRETLGDYLGEPEPAVALWADLVEVVHRDSPRLARVERLGAHARTLWDVGCFHGEVINGGFSQFLSNSSGDRAHESLDALRRIGAPLCASLLERALAAFPDGAAPSDRALRCDLLFAFEAREPRSLEELDRAFYERVDALGSTSEEDLPALEAAYMAAHREAAVVA
jgi:hypothetical protein